MTPRILPARLPDHLFDAFSAQVRKSVRLRLLERMEAFVDSPGLQEYLELTFVQVGRSSSSSRGEAGRGIPAAQPTAHGAPPPAAARLHRRRRPAAGL